MDKATKKELREFILDVLTKGCPEDECPQTAIENPVFDECRAHWTAIIKQVFKEPKDGEK